MLAYFTHHFSPFLWQWSGNWGIRYYSLAYILGFAAFYFGHLYFYRKGYSALKPEDVLDLLSWMVAGTLVGGRLGYCLLYDFQNTLEDPLSIIAFWREGGLRGMASHGGFIGIIIAAWWYAKRHGFEFWRLADNVATVAPIGIFSGRIANFINGELWGRPSNVPWAVIFPDAPSVNGVPVPRHPSQLYEAALEGLLLFALVWFVRQRRTAAGILALVFLGGYSFARIISECFREPDGQIGYYWGFATQGQLLSAGLLILTGILAWWRNRMEKSRQTTRS